MPTSFVPKQPVTPQPKGRRAGTNALLVIGVASLAAAGIAAGATFGYASYLESARDAKAVALEEAQRAVSIDTVQGFIRLRDRLDAAEGILDRHVELSEFFDVLERLTLQSVRFSTLSVAVSADRTAEIELAGVASTFNALAAQSVELANEKRIRRAIFSDIAINENGTVGFTLTATGEPRLITAGEVLPGIPDQPAPETTVPAPQP